MRKLASQGVAVLGVSHARTVVLNGREGPTRDSETPLSAGPKVSAAPNQVSMAFRRGQGTVSAIGQS